MILSTQDLSIGYRPARRRPLTIASGLNLWLKAGELVCLLGPNGAGKSTLLRSLAGMQKPLSGSVTLLGDDLLRLSTAELARRLSLVLAERPQVGNLSGYALVALGRYPHTNWLGQLSAHDEAMIHWAVEAVGAQDLAARPLLELSDGERQKLMIARALAQESKLMILDEPTAFLDLPRRVEIMQLLRELAESTGCAILLSTHDLDLALRNAHRLWLMSKDNPMQMGAPEDLILKGAFQAVFQNEGLCFDMESGAFQMQRKTLGLVQVRGEGIIALWTRRAVERVGFSPSAEAQTLSIDVLPDGWRLTSPQQMSHHATLYDLLKAIQTPL